MPKLTPSTPQLEDARQALAYNLVRLRQLRGWSQDTLAHESSVHRTMVAKLEKCRRNASMDSLVRLATALGVLVHELLIPASGQAPAVTGPAGKGAVASAQQDTAPEAAAAKF